MSLGYLWSALQASVECFAEEPKMTLPVSVADLEEHARKILPKFIYDYIAFGATELQTLHDNVQAFRR